MKSQKQMKSAILLVLGQKMEGYAVKKIIEMNALLFINIKNHNHNRLQILILQSLKTNRGRFRNGGNKLYKAFNLDWVRNIIFWSNQFYLSLQQTKKGK